MSRLAKSFHSDYVPPVRLHHTSLQFTALLAGLLLLPEAATAQNTSCSEGQSVLWSQVPEQNWAATQSLLEEIESVQVQHGEEQRGELVEDEPALTPEAPLSVDPKAAHLPELLAVAAGPTAMPEKPGLCLTELDPSCVRDPGSSTATTIRHFERCNFSDEHVEVEAQPRGEAQAYPRVEITTGPDGFGSGLDRPPSR